MNDQERPGFDPSCGWYANTRHGMCWALFHDESKQMNRQLHAEAEAVVEKVIESGNPPFGHWS